MDIGKLYDHIASAGHLSLNHIGAYVAAHPECKGALVYLVDSGYVKEKAGLYAITNKPFVDDTDEQDEGPETDWGRGDRDHLEYYDDDYER